MSIIDIITAFIIHITVPAIGLLAYLALVYQIRKEKTEDPPIIEFFLIFATYGALLVMILTALFWRSSGMASLGVFYLVFGAPFVMGVIAYRNRKKRQLSKYHLWSFRSGIWYLVIIPLMILSIMMIEPFYRGF